ncbi:MAG: HEAT repeat domain-containing protein [Bryobacterales bacterium]|nr:HEAT repeat domain-containing protein [Bryobacterales bacterium]
MATNFRQIAIAAAVFLPVTFAQPPADYSNLAWQTLKAGLENSDGAHRKEALSAAGTIHGDPRAVQAAKDRLANDKDILVRQTAADALGQIGSPEAIPDLRTALDDKPEVAFSAAKALWNLGDTATARDIFEQILVGERRETPTKMQKALKDAKHRLRPEQLAFMAAREVAGPGGPAIDAVQEILKLKGGPSGRAAVVEYFGEDTDPAALEFLEWALSDKNPEVRGAAAKALGERGNRDSTMKLVPLLTDDHQAVRYLAAASIIKLPQGGSETSGPAATAVLPRRK